LLQGGVIVALAVDIEWKNDVNHLGVAPIFSELDRYFAPLGLLGRFGARPGIEQCQFCHPFRRMPSNFKGDVAAHRQAGERKTVRCGGQDTPCNRGHAVITSMVGDGDRTEAPQIRDLLAIEPRRAAEAWNEHNWQRLCHRGTFLADAADYRSVKKSEESS
jgi:hypothetical protein